VTINKLIQEVNAGEMVILDNEISSHIWHWWQDVRHTNAVADWCFEVDDLASVFWVYKYRELRQ